MRLASLAFRSRFAAAAGLVLLAITAASPTDAARGGNSFVQAAQRAGFFKTFVGLIEKGSAADRLDAGPVTVFMPTDDAFARLSAAERAAIAALSPEDTRRFVDRFVIPGVALASNNIDQDIVAADGTSYNVTWYEGRLSLRDHQGPANGRLAFVIRGDYPAGKGVIDAVDAVLMPVSLDNPSAAGPAPAKGLAKPDTKLSAAPARTPALPAPALNNDAGAQGKAPESPAPDAPSSKPQSPPATPVGAQPLAAPPPPSPPAPTANTIASAPAALPEKTPAANPQVSVGFGELRNWPVRLSDGRTNGKVNGIFVGVPDGRVTGVMARFGGFFGFGGKLAYIPWQVVTADPQKHVLNVRMTVAELRAAPPKPPSP